MPAPLKIWITRARPGADATAARVRALGHEPFVAPLLEVRRAPDVRLDLSGVAALAFTSANAVRAFAELSEERGLRVFAVGAATAQAAKAAGFRHVLSADGDVAALAEGIAARRSEIGGVVLHPGAADPAGDLAGALAPSGVEVRQITLYETVEATLSSDEIAALQQIDVALVHSPKAGEVLATVLQAHPQPHLKLLAISQAALKPLLATPAAAKLSSPFPLEAALLNLIGR
jgi:uroporphyrinogen-III synthase